MKKRNKIVIVLFVVGLCILLTYILTILFYPYKYDVIVDEAHLSPSSKHIMGTHYLGRDIFIRICYGSLLTLFIAVFSLIISIFFATIIGVSAGYKGGKTKYITLTFINILECIPDFLLALILLVVFNNIFSFNGGILGIIVTLTLVSWTPLSRILINETSKLMSFNYIQYSLNHKAKFPHILTFHLLPNLKDTILVVSLQKLPSAIFLESFLSYVGVGIQPPFPSLGKMISDGVRHFRSYPLELIFPSLILILTVLFFNVMFEIIRQEQ